MMLTVATLPYTTITVVKYTNNSSVNNANILYDKRKNRFE